MRDNRDLAIRQARPELKDESPRLFDRLWLFIAIDRYVRRRRFRMLVLGEGDRGAQLQIRGDGPVRARHDLFEVGERVGARRSGDRALISRSGFSAAGFGAAL